MVLLRKEAATARAGHCLVFREVDNKAKKGKQLCSVWRGFKVEGTISACLQGDVGKQGTTSSMGEAFEGLVAKREIGKHGRS